jgi:hypothetical protein
MVGALSAYRFDLASWSLPSLSDRYQIVTHRHKRDSRHVDSYWRLSPASEKEKALQEDGRDTPVQWMFTRNVPSARKWCAGDGASKGFEKVAPSLQQGNAREARMFTQLRGLVETW